MPARAPPDEDRLTRWQRRIVQRLRSMWDSFESLPEKTVDDIDVLLDEAQRRDIAKSLRGETSLSPAQRRALITGLAWSTLLLWAVVSIIAIAIDVNAVGRIQTAYLLAFYSFATSVFLPIPYELLLRSSAAEIGTLSALLVSSGAKSLGTFVVMMLGQSANTIITSIIARNPTATRVFDGLQRLAGHPASLLVVFILFAIPFNSDTAILYLMAPLGIAKRWMVLLTFLAFMLRGAIVLALGSAIG